MTLVTQYPIDAIRSRLTSTTNEVTPARRFTPAEIRAWCEAHPDRLRAPKPEKKRRSVTVPSQQAYHDRRRRARAE
jgi:hypothetical protein